MANRHSHKKLRAEVRAHMATTGESYQSCRARILARHDTDASIDLVPFRFFGVPMTLATAEGEVVLSVTVLRTTPALARSYPMPLATWLRPQGVN